MLVFGGVYSGYNKSYTLVLSFQGSWFEIKQRDEIGIHQATWNPIPFPQHLKLITSSTAQGGGGSFKNRKPIGEIGCCESPMAEQKH